MKIRRPCRDPTTTTRVGVEAAEDDEVAENGEVVRDSEVAVEIPIDLQRPQREIHQPVWMNMTL